MNQILAFSEVRWAFERYILHVAAFNRRAIKVYCACGFVPQRVEKRPANGGEYEFVVMSRENR